MAPVVSLAPSPLCAASWPSERSRLNRSKRLPSLAPSGPTAACRPLRCVPRRHRKNGPPRRRGAPRQPPSLAQAQPPSSSNRSSRSPRVAAGRAAILGIPIFIFAAAWLPEGPTVNTIAPWPTWRRGPAAGRASALDSSRTGVSHACNWHLRSVALRPPARCPRLAFLPCRTRRRPSQVAHRHPLNREVSPC